MKKGLTIGLFGFVLLTVPVLITASENKPMLEVAVAKSEPAIRDITPSDKAVAGSSQNVKIIEIVSHTIQSPDQPHHDSNEALAKSAGEVGRVQAVERIDDVAQKAGSRNLDIDSEEELDDAADDGETVVLQDDEVAEEPCECEILAEGECVPCPDAESD